MNKSLSAIFFIIVITGCSQSGPGKFFAPDNKNIALIGRFDLSDISAPEFMYSGCAIRTIFSGTSVEVVLKDDSLKNMYNIFIDDTMFILKTNNPEGRYLLADSLRDGKHSLEIYRRTEWHAGNTTFNGLYVDRGKRLYKPEVKSRLLEFIGDSYTCGYGNEGKSREEHFSYETENNYLTYGSVTARQLNAEYVTECRSGIGMWQGYGGDTAFTMPKLYDQIIIKGTGSWDYKRYRPEVVAIDLGGNDLSAPLDSAAFVNTYTEFLTRIRNNYPDARIVCIAGPDVPGKSWVTWKSYMRTVVDNFCHTDKMTSYFEFSPFEPNGSDWHPNVEEHRRMAGELVPFIKDLMKW